MKIFLSVEDKAVIGSILVARKYELKDYMKKVSTFDSSKKEEFYRVCALSELFNTSGEVTIEYK